jgi:hypothetical protein
MACLCTAHEADYHSYKEEAAKGRWAINKNRKNSHGYPTAVACATSLNVMSIGIDTSTDGGQNYSNTTSPSTTPMPNGLSNAISCPDTT